MLTVNCLPHSVVLPPLGNSSSPLGGVVDADGRYVECSCPNAGAGGLYEPTSLVESSERVIYLGWLNDVWGHVITDVLKKLWFMGTADCQKLLREGAKLVYVTHLNGIPKHLERIFELLEIPINSLCCIDTPTRFAELYMPDDSFVSYGLHPHFTQEYIACIGRIKRNINDEGPWYDQVYFTRTHATRPFRWSTLWMPKEMNEERLEAVFERHGYQVIAPETLSVDRQIGLLMHCRAFAATEGSISHNAVFCALGTKVAILKKEVPENIYTQLCNEAAQVEAHVIVAHASKNVKSTFYGPFYLCITHALEEFFDERIPHLPYWLQLRWYWYMIYDTVLGRALQKLLRF